MRIPTKFSFVIPTKSESARKFSTPIISMTISPFVKPVQIPLKHNTKVEFSAPEVISGVHVFLKYVSYFLRVSVFFTSPPHDLRAHTQRLLLG